MHAAIEREEERRKARAPGADVKTQQVAMEESKEVEGDDTLLSHLVKMTSGMKPTLDVARARLTALYRSDSSEGRDAQHHDWLARQY